MKKNITITHTSSAPKYRQLVDNIIDNIGNGNFLKGQQLPSIAELAHAKKTAKATVAKAYDILKENGIILSRHGKGFYIASDAVKVKYNIFVLFDTMNAYKEILYNAFKHALPADARCSIFFHHYDVALFESLIKNNIGKYNFYIIMPHFDKDVSNILRQIPSEKLLLMDKDVPKLTGNYSAVYQDFENDVFNGLSKCITQLKKYKSLSLMQGNKQFQYVPAEIIKGFVKFCTKNKIQYNIFKNFDERDIKQNNAYIIFSDAELIRFIKYCNRMNWKLGKDVGLISYDETPMKELLANGITVITTDFENMGRKAGELIQKQLHEKVANPCKMIARKTL
jgi:DNA-binding transcriptional regulator YhcF (GntR family)